MDSYKLKKAFQDTIEVNGGDLAGLLSGEMISYFRGTTCARCGRTRNGKLVAS